MADTRANAHSCLQEHKGPRPINPFIMYCQVQKDIFAKSKTRRSASETRKIFGDMWRKCTEEVGRGLDRVDLVAVMA